MDAIRAAAAQLGVESLKLGQEAAIDAVLSGRDVVVIQATGWGKSLCFIVPPIVVRELTSHAHCTLIISPLLSLMRDQCAKLEGQGFPAIYCHGGMTNEEKADVATGRHVCVFSTPEFAVSHKRFLLDLKICLLAVDESHCLATWGQDFRQDYLRLDEIQSSLTVPTMVLSATMDRPTLATATRLLTIKKDAEYVVALPDRPNLFFHKVQTNGKPGRATLAWLEKVLRSDGKAIIYAEDASRIADIWEYMRTSFRVDSLFVGGTRKNTNLRVVMYSDAATDERRRYIEREFRKPDGTVRIVISTSGLGMGIDIPDIDAVVVWDLPQSALMLTQEFGRAGRALGVAGTCVFYWSQKNRTIRTKMEEKKGKALDPHLVNLMDLPTDQCLRQAILKPLAVTPALEEQLADVVGKAGPQCTLHECCSHCNDSCACGRKDQRMGYWVDSTAVEGLAEVSDEEYDIEQEILALETAATETVSSDGD